MITPEEFSKFEFLFEKLKLLILSDFSEKFYHINRLVVQIIYLKNEGRKNDTANELGVHVKTIRTYLEEYDVGKDLMDMHLNRLVVEGWFKELPESDQLEHMKIVQCVYNGETTVTSPDADCIDNFVY